MREKARTNPPGLWQCMGAPTLTNVGNCLADWWAGPSPISQTWTILSAAQDTAGEEVVNSAHRGVDAQEQINLSQSGIGILLDNQDRSGNIFNWDMHLSELPTTCSM